MTLRNTEPLPIGRFCQALCSDLSREQKLELVKDIAAQNNCAIHEVTFCAIGKEKALPISDAYRKHIIGDTDDLDDKAYKDVRDYPSKHNDLDLDQKLEALKRFAEENGLGVRVSHRYVIEYRTED